MKDHSSTTPPGVPKDPVLGVTLFPPLTDAQMKVLRFVHQYVLRERMYPTQREIGAELGYTQATAGQHLDALTEKGYLTKEKAGTRRNMRLTELAMEKLTNGNQLSLI